MRFGEWDEPLLHTRPKMSEAVVEWGKARSYVEIEELAAKRDAPADVLAYLDAVRQWNLDWEAAAKDRPWEGGPAYFDGVRFFGGRWIHREELLLRLGFDAASAKFGDVYWVECLDTYEKVARAGRMDDCRRVATAVYEYIGIRETAQRVLVGALRDARLAMEAAK